MTKIACVSDLHENLIEIQECDLLLIAGDITYAFKGDLLSQRAFLHNEFRAWLEDVPASEIVVIAGNHDQAIEAWGWDFDPPMPCHYLQDSSVELFGIKIYGSPWQLWFGDWAFNAPYNDGERFLGEKYSKIPNETDIIISHGPPYGYGDKTAGGERVGSRALTQALRVVQPALVVTGHIHPDAGEYRLHAKDTMIINASIVDESYAPVREPFIVEL